MTPCHAARHIGSPQLWRHNVFNRNMLRYSRRVTPIADREGQSTSRKDWLRDPCNSRWENASYNSLVRRTPVRPPRGAWLTLCPKGRCAGAGDEPGGWNRGMTGSPSLWYVYELGHVLMQRIAAGCQTASGRQDPRLAYDRNGICQASEAVE